LYNSISKTHTKLKTRSSQKIFLKMKKKGKEKDKTNKAFQPSHSENKCTPTKA